MKRIITWFSEDAQRVVYAVEALAVAALVIIITMENLS